MTENQVHKGRVQKSQEVVYNVQNDTKFNVCIVIIGGCSQLFK